MSWLVNSTVAWQLITNATKSGTHYNTTSSNSTADSSCLLLRGTFFISYGLTEIFIWLLCSVLTIVLNWIYLLNLRGCKDGKTSFSVYMVSFVLCNIFAGVAIHPAMAYDAYQKRSSCAMFYYLLVSFLFYILFTFSMAALIAVDRCLVIIRIIKKKYFVSRRNSYIAVTYVKPGLILIMSLSLSVLRVFLPDAVTKAITVSCVFSAFLCLASSVFIIWKLKIISKHRQRNISLSYPTLGRYRKTVLSMQVLICSLIVSILPICGTFLAMRIFKANVNKHVITIATKLFWLRPIFEPIADICIRSRLKMDSKLTTVVPMKQKAETA